MNASASPATPSSRTRQRVLLVDDHPPILVGLRAILQTHGILVCGEARSWAEALALAERVRPDVILTDTTLPDVDIFGGVSELRRRYPEVQVLALCEREECDRTTDLLDAGACGCVSKSDSPDTIAAAIRTAIEGNVFLNTRNTERLVRAFRRLRTAERRTADLLTDTERRVLVETAEGYTGPEVAERLSMTLAAVNTCRNHIMQKADLHSRSDLVHFALECGLLRPDPHADAST